MTTHRESTNLRPRFLVSSSIIFLLLLLFMRGGQIFSSLSLNMANFAIYKSFSQEQTAEKRQHALSSAAAFLGVNSRGTSVNMDPAEDTPMIQSALRGLSFHRLGDVNRAAKWYNVAARGEPIPEQQQPILISPWMELDQSGDFVLDANAQAWHLRPDTAPEADLVWTDNGTLQLSCSKVQEGGKIAILQWNQLFDIPYHHTLVLKTKIETGTVLNLETVIDGQLVRHLTHSGTGEWKNFTIPLQGDHLRYIYMIVREDGESSIKSCTAEIQSISFLLDKRFDNDSSG